MRMLWTTDCLASHSSPFQTGVFALVISCRPIAIPHPCSRKEPWLFSPSACRARGATSRPDIKMITKSWWPAQMGLWIVTFARERKACMCDQKGGPWYNTLLFKNLCFSPQRKSVLSHPLTLAWLSDLLQPMACEWKWCLSPLGHTWFSRLSSSSAMTAITVPDTGWAALLNHRI